MKTLAELNSSRTLSKKLYWSRLPGQFLNSTSGDELPSQSEQMVNILDWYHTLLEVIKKFENPNNKEAKILCVSPDVRVILEHMVFYKPLLKSTVDLYSTQEYGYRGDLMNYKVFDNAYHPTNIIDIISEDTNELIGSVVVKGMPS